MQEETVRRSSMQSSLESPLPPAETLRLSLVMFLCCDTENVIGQSGFLSVCWQVKCPERFKQAFKSCFRDVNTRFGSCWLWDSAEHVFTSSSFSWGGFTQRCCSCCCCRGSLVLFRRIRLSVVPCEEVATSWRQTDPFCFCRRSFELQDPETDSSPAGLVRVVRDASSDAPWWWTDSSQTGWDVVFFLYRWGWRRPWERGRTRPSARSRATKVSGQEVTRTQTGNCDDRSPTCWEINSPSWNWDLLGAGIKEHLPLLVTNVKNLKKFFIKNSYFFLSPVFYCAEENPVPFTPWRSHLGTPNNRGGESTEFSVRSPSCRSLFFPFHSPCGPNYDQFCWSEPDHMSSEPGF